MAESSKTETFIAYLASPDEVETGNIDLVQEAVEKALWSIKSRGSEQKHFPFGIGGYDDDPRPLSAIPEVRKWCGSLIKEFPYIFALIDEQTMYWLLPCICQIEFVNIGKNSSQIRWPSNLEEIVTKIANDAAKMLDIASSNEKEGQLLRDNFIARFQSAAQKLGI